MEEEDEEVEQMDGVRTDEMDDTYDENEDRDDDGDSSLMLEAEDHYFTDDRVDTVRDRNVSVQKAEQVLTEMIDSATDPVGKVHYALACV